MSSSVDVPPSRQGQAMDVDGDVLESQGAAGRSMPAAGPSDTSDPAATLRAAALMTLKRGRPRRGSSVVPAPPRRPLPASSRADIIPPDSVQLDYGSDEMIPAVVPVSKPAPASKNDKAAPSDDKSAPKDDKDASEDEEGQIREEGEISDSESTTPQHPSNVKTPAPKSTPAAEMPSPTPQIPSVDKLSLKPHPIRTSPPANPSTGSIAPLVASPISIAPTTRSSSLDTVQPVVDENHVRPGLAMTQVQYSTAQDIILDLLGWGVPPEYLVDYGLSREVIFYVFTDLHLRLPSNLDCTGLAEWHPPNGRLSAPSDMLSTRVPPPLQASRRRSSGHPSLPPKPSVPQGQVVTRTSSSGLSTSAAPFIPNTQPSPNTPLRPSSSLNDMEQQRRQELLARKAALASRKLKAAASLAETSSHSTPSSTASSPRAPPSASDIVMNMAGGAPKLTSVAFGDSFASMSTKAVPEATVEELLRAALVQASGTASDPNVMDVDEPIPGFGQITTASGSGSTSASASRASPPHHTADRAPRPGSKTSGPPPASGSAAAPFRSPPHDADATSANGTPSATSAHAEDDGAAPPPSASSFGSEASTVRRGTKRPVAADFVDFDPGPRARSRSNPHGQPDEVSHGHGQSLARLSRKNGSFAGLTGSRRCVIELSDDEGDDGRGDEGANGHGQRNGHEGGDNDGLARNGRPFWSPAPHIPYASGAATPTTSMSPRMLTQSPAALLEKEQEIKRMREMIAQREMLRKKKLALQAVSGATTGPPTPVSQMPGPTSNGTTFAVTPLARTPEVTAPTTPERKEDSNDDVHHDDPEHVKTELKSPLALKMPIGALTGGPPQTIDQQASMPDSRDDAAMAADVSPSSSDHGSPGGSYGREPGGSSSSSPPAPRDQEQEEPFGDADAQQLPEQQRYESYRSLFESYPLLRSRLGVGSRNEMRPRNVLRLASTPSSSAMACPDLRPLMLASLHKRLASGPRVCQFEVPGGGECRDSTCEDLHLGRALDAEPSDDDTARFLYESLPLAASSRPSMKAIKVALEELRARHGRDFERRVSDAWSLIAPPGS